MDSIDFDKIQAIKKERRNQKVNNLLFYSVTTVVFTLLCSSPLWFPPLYFSIKSLLFVSLPKIASFFLSARSLFIVGNLIVIFLFGESKIYSSIPSLLRQATWVSRPESSSSSTREIECKLENVVAAERKVIRAACEAEAKVIRATCQAGEEDRKLEEVIKGDEKSLEEAPEVDGELGLSTEELMKRADDFIAMVNKQIRLEAANVGSF